MHLGLQALEVWWRPEYQGVVLQPVTAVPRIAVQEIMVHSSGHTRLRLRQICA